MKIRIKYDSCWQNSFLTGSDEKPIDRKNERKFKSSSKSKEAIDRKEISQNTVLGILCRLIGDQRKLWQARQSDDYYFKNIESLIEYSHKEQLDYCETAFITNKSEDRPSQSSFIGVLPDDTPLFFGEYSKNLWSVLDFSLEELFNFILQPQPTLIPLGRASPNKGIRSRINEISKSNPIMLLDAKLEKLKLAIDKERSCQEEKNKSGKKLSEKDKNKLDHLSSKYFDFQNSEKEKIFSKTLMTVLNILKQKFPDKEYINKKNDQIYPMSLYGAGLYIMRDELETSGIDVAGFKNKNNNIQGFHSSGFNGIRDFLNPLTGNQKKCGGTPIELTKTKGGLIIELNIDKEKAEELEQMIEAAGVSSFYLGKKGLAYVEEIRI
jgi:hypothetical protein